MLNDLKITQQFIKKNLKATQMYMFTEGSVHLFLLCILSNIKMKYFPVN